jgi:hypothetical protein
MTKCRKVSKDILPMTVQQEGRRDSERASDSGWKRFGPTQGLSQTEFVEEDTRGRSVESALWREGTKYHNAERCADPLSRGVDLMARCPEFPYTRDSQVGGKSSTGRGIRLSTETLYVIVSFHIQCPRLMSSFKEPVQRAANRSLGANFLTVAWKSTMNPTRSAVCLDAHSSL